MQARYVPILVKKKKQAMEIRNGSCIVKVYPTPAGKYERWTVTWIDSANGRIRKTFKSEKDAKAWGREKAAELAGLSKKPITIFDKIGLNAARVALEPYGVSVERAVEEWISLRRECGTTIHAVMDFWKLNHTGITQKTVSDAVMELIDHKRQMGRSQIYVEELEWMLKKFEDSCRCNVSAVSSGAISQWLASQNGGPKFKRHLKGALSVLFTYCRQKGYVRRDWAELDMVELPSVKAPDTSIFTASEVKSILSHSFEHAVPATAILAFAGLRPAEIERLTWADVGGQYISVAATIAKTASRRTIPIQPNLAAWLAPYRPGKGRVWQRSHSWLNQAMRKAAKRAGVKWHRNALRHSFCSYRLAITNDASRVALEAGNSPSMIFRHYSALVTPEAAADWFDVCPPSSGVIKAS